MVSSGEVGLIEVSESVKPFGENPTKSLGDAKREGIGYGSEELLGIISLDLFGLRNIEGKKTKCIQLKYFLAEKRFKREQYNKTVTKISP